ncbi:MAG: hypothetical protein AB1918_13685 [Pseudomonadota bacterium]
MELSLNLVKVVSAILLSSAAAAGAGWTVRSEGGIALRLTRATVIGLLSVVILVRGAPHNNPLMYTIFDSFGVGGLLAAVGLVLGGGFAAGLLVAGKPARNRLAAVAESGRVVGWAIGALCLLALLAAAQQVAAHWNVPPWGDSVAWHRLTTIMSRGDQLEGMSYYMPVYQYGAAFLHWSFGHGFAVMQVANLLVAPVTVLAACMAAWAASRNAWTVLLVGSLAATHDYLRFTPEVMQIENWYVPALTLALWAALRTRAEPSAKASAVLGLASGLAFGIRAQGAFFNALLLTAPGWGAGTPWRRRAVGVVVAGMAFAVAITPWTLRNWAVEGRLSPTSAQSAWHMAMTAHPGSFHGIRRDRVSMAEWDEHYPDRVERDRAMAAYALQRVVEQPSLLLERAGWLTLSYYGLLPDAVFAADGPPDHFSPALFDKTWLLRNLATLCVLSAAALGAALRRDRLAGFLLTGVAANMVVVLLAGFSEARIHYPLLPLFFLLAAAGAVPGKTGAAPVLPPARRAWQAAALLLAACLVGRLAWGQAHAFRSIDEPEVTIEVTARVGTELPDRSNDFQAVLDQHLMTPADVRPGDRFALTLALSNYHQPVRWFSEELRGVPAFTLEPDAPAYFRAWVVGDAGNCSWARSAPVSVRLAGAVASVPLREDAVVRVDATVLAVDHGLTYLAVHTVEATGRRCKASVSFD